MVPPSVEYWNVIDPVGVPTEPVTVTEAVTEPPKVIGLTGFKVGAGTVGDPLLTVKVTEAEPVVPET